MIEVERKYRLSSEKLAHIGEQLALRGTFVGQENQIDRVFLTKTESFKDFKRGDPVARIRTVNGTHTLTYKRALNEEGDMLEHELSVDSSEVAALLLKEMSYREVSKIEKERKLFSLEGISVCIDTVKDLGVYLEIEIMCTSSDEVPTAQTRAAECAASFGLSVADIELKKYDVLLDEKKLRYL